MEMDMNNPLAAMMMSMLGGFNGNGDVINMDDNQQVENTHDEEEKLIDDKLNYTLPQDEENIPVTFDKMQIAIDNRDLAWFCNLLNNHPVSLVFYELVKYAYEEMKVFAKKGARLKPDNFKQFIDIMIEVFKSRSVTIGINLNDNAKKNMDLIATKADSIDMEFCSKFNNHFNIGSDFEIAKFVVKGDSNMCNKPIDDEMMDTEHCCCDCNDDEFVDGCFVDGCDELAEYSGNGDVVHYHAPIINFNAPIINLGDGPDAFEKVRNFLLDFYNTHED